MRMILCRRPSPMPTPHRRLLKDGFDALNELRNEHAQANLAEALVLAERARDTRSVADAKMGLGQVEYRTGRRDAARVHYEDALQLYKKLGAHRDQAFALQGLGSINNDRDRKDEAREQYLEALRLQRQHGDAEDQAAVLVSLGTLEHLQNRHDDAHAYYIEARQLYQQCGKAEGEADVLAELGPLELAQGNPTEGISKLKRALEIYRFCKNRHGEANTLCALGNALRTTNQLEEAWTCLTNARQLSKQLNDATCEGNALDGMGEVKCKQDLLEEGRAHFLEALTLQKREHNSLGAASAHFGLGNIERMNHRLDEASRHFNQSLHYNRLANNQLGEANTYDCLGEMALEQDQPVEAQKYLHKSLQLYRQMGHQLGEANSLNGLGSIELAQDRPAEARLHLNAALKLQQAVGNEMGIADAISGLGQVAINLGNVAEGRQRLEEARDIFRTAGNPSGEATMFKHLGVLRLQERQFDLARADFDAALRLGRQADNVIIQGYALLGLGCADMEQQKESSGRQNLRNAAILFAQIGQEAQRAKAMELASASWSAPSKPSRRRLLGWGAALLGGAAVGGLGYAMWRTSSQTPPAQQAARWHTLSNVPSDTAIVFVHGILSGPGTAWGNWPDIVAADPRIATALGGRPDIFLAAYHTSADSGPYKMENAADELLMQLRNQSAQGQQAVLTRQRIVFIAHSTGGIVVRDVLERFRKDFSGKTIGLVLMASPSRGSAWADRLEMLSNLAGNKMAQQLSPGNDYLTNLDRRFADFLQAPDFSITGVDVFEQKLVANAERIVNPDTQSSYFGAPRVAADTDHFTVVKPTTADHPSHLYLVDYLQHKFNTKANSAAQ